jgi:hypothetical protein
MIDEIRSDANLRDFICTDCEENGVSITVHPSVDPKDYVIIKADAYLQHEFNPEAPAGPDCLIVQKCSDSTFRIFIVELKNIKDLGSYSLTEIRQKFQNCFDIIMSDKKRSVFYNTQFEITSIYLIFISNAREHLRREPDDKKQKNTRLDSLLALRPCRFAGKYYSLMFRPPNPTIGSC